MTRQRHYHPLAALRFLRKAVVVCLLPLANALLEFSLNALLTALRQDAALLLFLCGASSILLEASSWALDEAGVLRLRWAFISKRERIIRGEALAALTIERPLFFRLLGASRVVLYPVGQPAKRAVTLYLHKEDAQELADRLMPVRDPVCHRPAGGERAALVVLGANGLSTLALTYLAIRQSRPFPLTAEAVALSRLNVLVRFAAHWLPAGAAWMLVLAGSLFGISLARSFVQTVHYTVWHTADQLGSRGGWLSRFEFRVRSSEISYADVRVSPIARLMKRWPVFVVAGSCRAVGADEGEDGPLPDAEFDVLHQGRFAVADGKVLGAAVEFRIAHSRPSCVWRRTSSQMTTGAPKTAVTELMDSSVGANRLRAMRSQSRQNAAPPRQQPGRT